DGNAGAVGAAGEAEGDLPIVIGSGPAARTGGPQEQAFPGRQTPERGVIDLAGELEERALVSIGHLAGRQVVRLGEVVDRHGDVDALDVVVRDADGPAKVRRGAAGGVATDGLQGLGDVLRAAAGVEAEGRIASLGRVWVLERRIVNRAGPDALVGMCGIDVDRL